MDCAFTKNPTALGHVRLFSPFVMNVTPLGHGRYTLHLPPEMRPEPLLAELSNRGATVESMNPVRETLEDFFLKQITSAEARQTEGL